MNQIKEQTNPNLLIQKLNDGEVESDPQARGLWLPAQSSTSW